METPQRYLSYSHTKRETEGDQYCVDVYLASFENTITAAFPNSQNKMGHLEFPAQKYPQNTVWNQTNPAHANNLCKVPNHCNMQYSATLGIIVNKRTTVVTVQQFEENLAQLL